MKLAKAYKDANEESTRLLESTSDAFVALDPRGRITYANAEAERLTGVKREQILGRNCWEFFPDAIGTALERELSRVTREQVAADFE